MTENKSSFFSVSSEFIVTGGPAAYDLYVNSSSIKGKQHFVRIFPKDQDISDEDVKRLKDKYHQLYVPEGQRGLYLKSLAKSEQITDQEKTKVIKDAAITYLDRLFDPEKEFTTEVLNETIEGCRETVEAMVDVVHKHDIQSLQKQIATLSFHDFYTYDHSINVSMYCITLMKALVPSATHGELLTAGLGGLLHDLGKIKIPTEILNKSEKLTDDDFALIKEHPANGMGMLSENGVEAPDEVNLEVVRRVVYEHHENFNGTGYPNGLSGNAIHVMARVAAIADFFDAITTKRSYHEALSIEEALALMEKSKGKKLDPKLFELFAQHVRSSHPIKQIEQAAGVLPDDFDPCQPQQKLPITQSHGKIIKGKKTKL